MRKFQQEELPELSKKCHNHNALRTQLQYSQMCAGRYEPVKKKAIIISLWIYGIAGRCFIGVCWTWQNNLPVLPKTNAMAAAIKNHDNNYAGVFVLRWTCVLFSGVCLDIVRWAVTEWHDGRYQPGACYSTCTKITQHWCAPSWQKWIASTVVPLRWLQEARVGEG